MSNFEKAYDHAEKRCRNIYFDTIRHLLQLVQSAFSGVEQTESNPLGEGTTKTFRSEAAREERKTRVRGMM